MESPLQPASRRMNVLSIIALAIDLVMLPALCLMTFSALNPYLLGIPLLAVGAALVMSIFGLVQIHRSNGTQGGRGFAIAAITISGLIFLTTCALLAFGAFAAMAGGAY